MGRGYMIRGSPPHTLCTEQQTGYLTKATKVVYSYTLLTGLGIWSGSILALGCPCCIGAVGSPPGGPGCRG